MRVEPRAEWAQILREAWRINRDYFYATNMHGADWNAVRQKYEELLPHLATRDDLNRVMRMMLSELSVGHSYLGGGERLYEPKPIPVGLLGRRLRGRRRPLPIQDDLRRGLLGPEPSRTARPPPASTSSRATFSSRSTARRSRPTARSTARSRRTAGKRVELKVGAKADGSAARTVLVEPIADEAALRNRAWVEGNLQKVHERTKGRVAYVYVPNTAGSGYEYFKRYFFPQAGKEAIIVDERFNGGGQVADYYIEILRKPLVSYWATRYGETIRTPSAAILGPKVMIIDETAGSGGDLLPWMFRKFGLGKLVGKRTWGGLVGILGFPVLDGRRRRDGARPGDLHRGRLGRRKRGRSSRYRRRARPGKWPRARTRSSTGPSRSSWRSSRKTRRPSPRPGRRSRSAFAFQHKPPPPDKIEMTPAPVRSIRDPRRAG